MTSPIPVPDPENSRRTTRAKRWTSGASGRTSRTAGGAERAIDGMMPSAADIRARNGPPFANGSTVSPDDEPDAVHLLLAEVPQAMRSRRVEPDRISWVELEPFEAELNPEAAGDDDPVLATGVTHHRRVRCRRSTHVVHDVE